MTVHTLTAATPDVVVAEGMILKLEAIDPTTGAAVTGVSATAWTICGDDESFGPDDLPDVPVALPLLTYGPEATGS